MYSSGDEGIRHATWLELFFDLVFVVAVAELGSYLHHHLTIQDIFAFAGLFLIVWWVWLSYSYYADLFDTEDVVSRLMLIAAMFIIIFLAQSADDALAGSSFAFAVSLFALRGILTVFYLRAQQNSGEEHKFIHFLTVSNVLTTFILGVSLLVPAPGRFGLWGAAVITNLGAVVVIYTVLDVVVVQTSHLPERLGLMTILVLGETILAVSFGTSIRAPDAETLTVGALGFLVAVSVWWIYFQHFDEQLVDRLLDPHQEAWLSARQRGLLYAFSHYFTHMGIVAAGVGIIVLLEASLTGLTTGSGGVAVLCAGVALFLFGSSLSHQALPEGIGSHVIKSRLLVAGGLLVYSSLGIRYSPILTLVLIGGALLSLIVLDNWTPESAAGELDADA